MCGIIAAATEKSVGKLLVQGLYKMEYRGYDSAGVALHQENDIAHLRSLGKVKKLESKMIKEKPKGWNSAYKMGYPRQTFRRERPSTRF